MPPLSLPAPIAVIDVETTGKFPFRHDRIVEIAAVVIRDEGQIDREFVSLVNPERDIGPSSIHGLVSEDVLEAPRFGEIAALLVDVLTGCVAIAAHNVRFDKEFLEYEFRRAGYPLPECFSLCTMQLAGGGRLAKCCAEHGVSLEGNAHHALTDARATAHLLTSLLPNQPDLLREIARLAPIGWPTIPRTDRKPLTRDESRSYQTGPPTFLQRLLSRMQDSALSPASDDAVMAYGALLDRVLEDRCVDCSEADALLEMATRWGLNGDQIRLVHHDYLNRLAIAAVADGMVTDRERHDLKLVSRLLGHELPNLDRVLDEVAAKVAATLDSRVLAKTSGSSLVGKRVCFTGEMQCSHMGQVISRKHAEELAIKAGLEVMDSVTKSLDLLVVADPHTQSGKAKKAREYGIRIMHELVFWRELGVEVD